MTKYEPIHNWLIKQAGPEIRVTFAEIEALIHAGLPRSARQYDEWWKGRTQEGSRHSGAWLGAGWYVAKVDRDCEKVTFRRS